jgi:long-chain acyl-CoA synthetase
MDKNIWIRNYPAGVHSEIDKNLYRSVPELLEISVKKYHDQVAFVNFDKGLTFAEIDTLSGYFAAYLQNLGLHPGDRLAIQMPNLLQYPVVLFGALKAGLIIVNTNPLYTPREMEHHFRDSGAKVIIILANFAFNLEQIIGKTGIQHIIITEMGDLVGGLKGLMINWVVKKIRKMVPSYNLPEVITFKKAMKAGSRMSFKPVKIEGSDIAFLQYTGGTTGISMGATLTHYNILANMLQVREWMRPKLFEGELVITALPLYHIFALTVNFLCFFQMGAKNVLITNPRDIGSFVKELKKYPFTFLSGVNTLFNALLNHPKIGEVNFSHLKVAVGGGMAVQAGVANRWKALTTIPLVEGYGLSETSPVAACNPIDGREQNGSIGMPLPETEMMVVDEEGREVQLGEPGEICIRGPQVMKGYWNREKETSDAFLEGGWFKTGDIGILKEDGFFKIIDRKKDMILVSGFNVYPNEIEDVVSKMEDVLEVAAIGIPDENSGEAVKLFIVPRNPELTSEKILHYCRKNFTQYKLPKYIEFTNELPKTNIGKILRRLLREAELAKLKTGSGQ